MKKDRIEETTPLKNPAFAANCNADAKSIKEGSALKMELESTWDHTEQTTEEKYTDHELNSGQHQQG